ncbi:hypothetical protein [Peribacillus glennii]|uniref:Sodium:solute symporter family protein n=1 Tax=Peribacillus glennii TaxID=2303991 RepID=A0A372LEW8_9BACI|nr:hypothetical protein [Peribacillus glennii]RFU64851.1 hypothetical protein D0466_02705 [Peribacillus glennii]
MFDWYYFLFFGAGILIYCLEIIGAHRSFEDYFTPTAQYGIGKGTVMVWAGFFSAWTYEMAFFSSIAFGLGVSILYWLSFYMLVYILLSRFMPLAIKQAATENILGLSDLYFRRFPRKGRQLSFIILFLANLDGLIIQPIFALWLFRMLFNVNGLLFISLLVSFCVIISGLGGIAGITRAIKVLMIVSGAALVFLPIYLYVIKGIEQVYGQYRHWSLLHTANSEYMLLFFLIVVSLAFSKISTSLFVWRVLLSVKRPHFSSTIKLAVLGSASFSLSLLAYFVYIASQHIDSNWKAIIQSFTDIQGTLLLTVATFIWFITVAYSIIFSLYSINSLVSAFLEQFGSKLATTKRVYLFSLIVGAVSVLFASSLFGRSLHIVFIYILYASSIAIPSMAILFKRGNLPSWIPMAILFVSMGTIAFYCLNNSFSLSLYIGLISSFLLGLIIHYSDFSENNKII